MTNFFKKNEKSENYEKKFGRHSSGNLMIFRRSRKWQKWQKVISRGVQKWSNSWKSMTPDLISGWPLILTWKRHRFWHEN